MIQSTIEWALARERLRSRVARRSGVSYFQHVAEGVAILAALGAPLVAQQAYCLHPLTQSDEEFNVNLDLLGRCNGAAVALAIEYRWVANQNARGVVCAPHGRIRLSCLPLVNTMLVADKVQNRKDFLASFSAAKHPEYGELVRYFVLWMEALEISDERYVELTALLPPALQPLLDAMIAAPIPETFTDAEQVELTAGKERDIRIARSILDALPDGPLTEEAWVWLLPGALSQDETAAGFRSLAYSWFDTQSPAAAALPEIAAVLDRTQAPFLRDLASRLRRIDEQNPRNRGRTIRGHCRSLALYLATQSAPPEIVTAFRQLLRLA
jgi:hypothetical protein